MNNRARIIVAVFVALVCGVIFWAVRTVPNPPDASAPVEVKVMKYSNNTISEEKNGKKLWEMTAEEIEVNPDTNNADLKNISGMFYQDNGTVVRIKAPHAFYEVQAKNIKIDGGVMVDTTDGAKMDAQTLNWEASAGTLTGDGNVKITKEDVIAVGDKIESKDGFQNFKLMGHAHITKGRAQ